MSSRASDVSKGEGKALETRVVVMPASRRRSATERPVTPALWGVSSGAGPSAGVGRRWWDGGGG